MSGFKQARNSQSFKKNTIYWYHQKDYQTLHWYLTRLKIGKLNHSAR